MTTPKGGRPATGSVKWRHNPDRVDPVTGKPAPGMQWWGRVTKANGRGFVPLDPSILERVRRRDGRVVPRQPNDREDGPGDGERVRQAVVRLAGVTRHGLREGRPGTAQESRP
jgi:hypothetical protein